MGDAGVFSTLTRVDSTSHSRMWLSPRCCRKSRYASKSISSAPQPLVVNSYPLYDPPKSTACVPSSLKYRGLEANTCNGYCMDGTGVGVTVYVAVGVGVLLSVGVWPA